jgi:hypothetical protein
VTGRRIRAAQPDRALRYAELADALGVPPARAYAVADGALDVDLQPLIASDALLVYAQASIDGDDDFDDFRAELRRIWPDLTDPDAPRSSS